MCFFFVLIQLDELFLKVKVVDIFIIFYTNI